MATLLRLGADGSLGYSKWGGRPFISVTDETLNGRTARVISICTFGMQPQQRRSWPRVDITLTPLANPSHHMLDLPPAVDLSECDRGMPFRQTRVTLQAPTGMHDSSLEVAIDAHAVKLYLLPEQVGQQWTVRK